MKFRILMAVTLSVLSYGGAFSQSEVDLDSLDRKVKQHLQSKMPGWTHRRGTPITGSGNVLIEKWTSPNRGIKISIVPYKSASEAHDVLLGSFLKYDKGREEVKGIGSEAFTWGWQGSNLVFRKGKYLVYLSGGYDADSDVELRMLDQVQKQRRQIQEIKRINKEFAKHIVDGIDLR